MPNPLLDVLVIGGGQAGLAVGYHLCQSGLSFLIVDAAPEVGYSWQSRYDSLRLFTPVKRNSLPGLPFPGEPEHYPSKDEVAEYLRSYVEAFDLPVQLSTAMTRLSRAEGVFVAETSRGELIARQVLVATGAFGKPYIPAFACHLDAKVVQLHSSEYRNPRQVPRGKVLVVGSGNSGAQIAEELAESHDVLVAMGRRQARLPQRLLGRDIFDWSDLVKLFDQPVYSRLGRLVKRRDPVIGVDIHRLARQGKLELKPRVVGAVGSVARFADGSATDTPAVVWATGFQRGLEWLELPVFDEHGAVQHQRGVTSIPGVYFVGLSWQHTRSSALLGGVGRDAAFIAEQVVALHKGTAPPGSETRLA